MVSPSSDAAPPPAAWHSFVSLLIFGHLFFVFVALGSNYVRSPLTDTVLDRFAFYTRLLNLDLNYTPFHLTHGTDMDVDHRIEVLPRDGDAWLTLPGEGFRGADSYKRYQRYASTWAYQAAADLEPALFARAVGTHYSQQREIAPRQIRVRKHFQQSREELASGTASQRDPDAPSRFAVSYAANAIVNPNGSVDVVKVEETGQVAVPVNSAGGARGTSANERGR